MITVLAFLGLIFLFLFCSWIYQEYLKPKLYPPTPSANRGSFDIFHKIRLDGVYIGSVTTASSEDLVILLVFTNTLKVVKYQVRSYDKRLGAAGVMQDFYSRVTHQFDILPSEWVSRYAVMGEKVFMCFVHGDGVSLSISGKVIGGDIHSTLEYIENKKVLNTVAIHFRFIPLN